MAAEPALNKEIQSPVVVDGATPAIPKQRRLRASAGRPNDSATAEATPVPRLPRVYVPRDRLWHQLEDVTRSGVTLLVAPAGAGKTLGVAGWLRESGRAARTGWIDADAGWTAQRLAEQLALLDVEKVPGQAHPLLVIDDAHRLPAPCLRLLDDHLNNAPDGLHLVLLSRWDLPLTRLVPELLGHLSILRGEVLRMTDAECVPLIVEHARTEEPEVIRSVTGRSHGWAAAVVLASRAIAAAPDTVAAARRYAEGDASVADRLANEVFATLQPRQRHLLLCVANEETVTTEEAAHLSHDARAAEVLAGLEATGLLVTRLTPTPSVQDSVTDDDEAAAPEQQVRYRIHPLLIEVVRRRLVAGGVDVAQAQSTIRRAVRLDVARGQTDRAFARLVAAQEPAEATRVLAEHGIAILMRGHGGAIASFARLHPGFVESTPDTWFALALERWLDNDARGAGHWLDRILAETDAASEQRELSSRRACARLMRARLGTEPAAAAIGYARRVLMAQVRDNAADPFLPLLVGELGVVQTWLGDLVEAEVNLTTCVALSRARGLTRLASSALSHLALTVYMQGRESACIEIANEALEAAAGITWRAAFTRSRALLARDLAQMSDLPWPEQSAQPAAGETPSAPADDRSAMHVGDPVGQFWARLRDARLALTAGSVPTAQQTLEIPHTWLAMSEHLRVILIIERAFLASLSGDQQALKALEVELESLGARGEASLLTGLRHELESDRKSAAAAYAVAEADVTYAQPPSRALALTCEAQLLDVLGHPDDALQRLREAATITEVRRNAAPFLGWSRQGTPIQTLLKRLERETSTAWIQELAASADGNPDVATMFAPMTATPRERARVTDQTVRPSLSPREREVLNELARGATYADIAADLFVSENTIKTHVSSLYGKLAVTRRSEALAVARNLHLL